MVDIDKTAPVLVTGATGYVAGWLIKKLLEGGATVHAAVRDPQRTDKTAHLTALADNSPGSITFFKADLLEEGSYDEGMRDCRLVFHTASPFTTTVTDPQRDLIDPAQLGTRNVLQSASRIASVERVVVTSSCAAIYTDCADVQNAPGQVLTEAVWNTSASLDYQPYSYSKTLAEQEAWKLAEAQDRWRLVVVNPSLVVGPGTNPRPTSESFNLIKQFGDGTMKRGAPRIGIGTVDVRDLADAHIAAGFRPDAEGRHIISNTGTDFLEMAKTLLPRFGDAYPIPQKALPKWLLWLIGPMVANLPRRYITRNVNLPWRADNAKSIEKLGMQYRPLSESMNDMFAQMIDAGYFTDG